jgi:dimeric dUTPase (all-alpha-NTP-PPase superfamily)|tara:strand:+ start:411 stop:782 length:372 start_codon:yes stop_codon:yes gene_type:complete
MEKKLQRARFALMTMFEVFEKDILFMNSRKQPIVQARMFYNYYLWEKHKIPHNHIKNYIEGMHHATSIYLKNKLENEMKQYDSVQMQWLTFLFFIDYEDNFNKEWLEQQPPYYKVWKQKGEYK